MRSYLPYLLIAISIVLFIFSRDNIDKKAQTILPPVEKTYTYIPVSIEEHLTYKTLVENLVKEKKLNLKVNLGENSIKIEGDREVLYKFLEVLSFIKDIQNIGKVQFKTLCIGEDCGGLQIEVVFMKLMIEPNNQFTNNFIMNNEQ
ncbi:MAG: hypothetical protein NC925_05260 [Candidatus Omnitrophica bacterium]|nr:hypothetical protein [Candidatus Omnitrophota bacterium]